MVNKKLLCWEKMFLICSILFFLAVVLPLFALAKYAVPWYDDYDAALYTHSFLNLEDHFLLSNLIKGVAFRVKTSWYAWQGTYASIALMALCPIEHYSIGCRALLLVYLLSLFVLSHVLMKRFLKADRSSYCAMTAFIAGVTLLTFHSPAEGLFWYNGGVHYVGMFSLEMLFLSCLIALLDQKKAWRVIGLELAAVILAIMTAGGNFVGVMYGGLCILTIMGLALIGRNRNVLLLLAPACAYALGMYFNLSAPGNMVRQSYFADSRYGFFQSVFASFRSAFEFVFVFKGMLFLLAAMILAAPVILRMVQDTDFRFPCPILVSVWSFCMYAAGFAPSYFGMGIPGAGRTINIIKLLLTILLFLNEIYWLGWRSSCLRKKKGEIPKLGHSGLYLAAATVLLLGSFAINGEKEASFSSYAAARSMINGEAKIFYIENLERKAIIESEEQDMVFRPHTVLPALLSIADYSADPNAGPNRMLCSYYSKNSLRVE